MKVKIISTISISLILNSILSFSQSAKKQTLIPLDNKTGVPFYTTEEIKDHFIDGFEIDEKGNFYFLSGGQTPLIAAFAGSKLLYRKNCAEMIYASQLYYDKGNLYSYRRLPPNELFVVDKSTGALIRKYQQITKEKINSHRFVDSGLVLEVMEGHDFLYKQYSLNGTFMKGVPTRYKLDRSAIPTQIPSNYELLGKWEGAYVLYSFFIDRPEKIWLVSKEGRLLSSRSLPKNFSGDGYAENPPEHRKVRNGKLYVLGRIGRYAMITEIPLNSIFSK